MPYEYKIMRIDTSGFWFGADIDEKKLLKKIDSLTKNEWELISAAPFTEGSMMKNFGSTTFLLLFFKRPKK